MNKEDYFKYYIQGSDHYLIPKDIFEELFDEMNNWKEEAKELKKQLKQYQEEVCILDMRTDENIKYKNQQQEFIKWLIENESLDDYCNETTFTSIREKYEEIIGNDINVGSKGGKDE